MWIFWLFRLFWQINNFSSFYFYSHHLLHTEKTIKRNISRLIFLLSHFLLFCLLSSPFLSFPFQSFLWIPLCIIHYIPCSSHSGDIFIIFCCCHSCFHVDCFIFISTLLHRASRACSSSASASFGSSAEQGGNKEKAIDMEAAMAAAEDDEDISAMRGARYVMDDT